MGCLKNLFLPGLEDVKTKVNRINSKLCEQNELDSKSVSDEGECFTSQLQEFDRWQKAMSGSKCNVCCSLS